MMRWRIAHALNRLPWFCWADLVTWALRWDTRLRDSGVSSACRNDLANNGACYCGKLRSPAPREEVKL